MKNSRALITLLALLLLLIFMLPTDGLVIAQTPTPTPKVVIYIFWGDGCPHCAEAKPFLEELTAKYKGVELREYEVWYNVQNQQIFTQIMQANGQTPGGVPAIFIGTNYYEGYSKVYNENYEGVVVDCLQKGGCPDAGASVLDPNRPTVTPLIPISIAPPEMFTTLTPQAGLAGTPTQIVPTSTPTPAAAFNRDIIELPLVGKVDLAGQSLTLSTILIAFVDGFNPCSVWVLTMLLALTLHSGSRKKVVIIGIIFLTVTAAIYALFIAGLFTMFTVINFVGWIQIVVAVVALFFALVNIKDYFWYKEGVSFTISDEKKPGIFQRMRRVMDASQSFWGMAGATVILAAGVSLVEFSCTAGFPVLWTNLLVSQRVAPLEFALLLLVYLLIYQLDELVIFFAAVFTLRASRLEEKHGRMLKLAGGVLMLTLAAVMLIKPALLNSINSALIIFAIAFGIVALILLLHRKILPALGIRIGNGWK